MFTTIDNINIGYNFKNVINLSKLFDSTITKYNFSYGTLNLY